ncbi:hypothetical protein GCM10009613_42470 [Pseudonocardia kongjuensis]|uniref:Uncharacterized protein n=1 Tax=Pseudonocardia kongjuensis TaxID=102227 RepID=A0ABN1Y0A7_9PSEU
MPRAVGEQIEHPPAVQARPVRWPDGLLDPPLDPVRGAAEHGRGGRGAGAGFGGGHGHPPGWRVRGSDEIAVIVNTVTFN